jgi:hypothetical protein
MAGIIKIKKSMDKVDKHIERKKDQIKPPSFDIIKAISTPIRHKQIKKAQFNKGIAIKCDIHNEE